MKAFILDRYGSADRVRAGDRPDPEVREDDVLVQIHAAGVNPLDSKIRSGEFKRILPYRLPLVLGNEVAGVVARVGSRVRSFKPGDEVYARPDQGRIGAFAEFISITEADVAHKPKALTMEEAASIPLVGLTAGGQLISISGPPDPDFAKAIGSSWIVSLVMRLLSYRIRRKARRHHVGYSFRLMRASGDQLREIAALIDSGIIRAVVDRVFPFEATKEAMAYVETGRAKGKVVVKVR